MAAEDSMPVVPNPADVEAGKAALAAGGIEGDAAMQLAEIANNQGIAPPSAEGMEDMGEPPDPFDSAMMGKHGEGWKTTPDSIKEEMRALYDALADIDLPAEAEDVIAKETKDVTDAAESGDKELMMKEMEDLKKKLEKLELEKGELENGHNALKGEYEGNLALVAKALGKHLKDTLMSQASDLADDEEVLGMIEKYFDNLSPDADYFDHADDAVTLAVTKARKAGKGPPKVEAAVVVEAEPKRDDSKKGEDSSGPKLPGMMTPVPMMSESADGKGGSKAKGKSEFSSFVDDLKKKGSRK